MHNKYRIWKDMALNDSLTPVEKSKLAVWDYPVLDKFTKVDKMKYICNRFLLFSNPIYFNLKTHQ